MDKMYNPLINVITRFSRKKQIENVIKELSSQTYNNVRHYITYETTEGLKQLKSLKYKYDTKFIRVPNFKHIPNLHIAYEHHDLDSDYVDWDWEKWKVKIHFTPPGLIDPIPERRDDRIPCTMKRFEKNGWWCTTLTHSLFVIQGHFPFNIYLKLAEQHINEGWITYLDDDDGYPSNNSLETLSHHIRQHDIDTLHISRIMGMGGYRYPNDKIFQNNKTGHPPMIWALGSANLCFHSKWKQYTRWDEFKGSDYRTGRSLYDSIPKVNWIEEPLYHIGIKF